MNLRQRHLVPLILTLLIPVVAFGSIPDINQCSIGTRATEDVSVMVCPGCDGYAFSYNRSFHQEQRRARHPWYPRYGYRDR